MYSEEEQKKREIISAKAELTEWEAIKVLLKNNNLACHIKIAGMELGVCQNKKLLPVVEFHIKEINKFLNNEKNLWE